MPYIYYLGYEITLTNNNQKQILKYRESDKGFIEIDLPSNIEQAQMEVRYAGTTLTKISYVLTILGMIWLIIDVIKRDRVFKQD